MAFRKKAVHILSEQPDIVIVSECENPEKLKFGKDILPPNDIFWHGDNPNKGVAVLSYSDFKITKLSIHNENFRYVVPLLLSDQKTEIVLLAIWCQKPDHHDNYGIHTWNAINYYSELLQRKNIIIAGDFNSSSIWDKPNREANHTNIVHFLSGHEIVSTYHLFYEQEQGKEKDPTLYLHRKLERPYHIDYCFASKELTKKLSEVKIGKYDEWTRYSDHKPIIVTFENLD